MLDVVICVSTNLFRVYLIYKFIQIFVEDQKQGKIKEAAAYTAFFLVNTGLYLLLHMAWVNLLCNLLGMGFLVSLYTKSWKKIFFVAGSVCLINAGCDIFSVLVFSGYEEGTPINQLCSLPMVFLVFICELITERIMKVRRNKIDEVQSLPLMLVPLCSIGMILFILYCNNISDWEIVGISIGLMVINFLVFYLYNLLLKAFSEKCENEVLKQKIEIYTNQIDTILQSEKEVRALRHDMKHHMNEIMLLAEKNETAEI